MGDGECLKKNLDELGYDATNLLSCMTLDVENLHSVVHHKSGVSTALQYIRDCGSTAKESLKQTTAWSAYYYTSRGLWYPVPERSLAMFEIPSMSQTSVVKASKGEISMIGSGQDHMDLLYGKEVTMARAGTLPDFLYQKEIEVGERINLSSVWQPRTSAQYPASLMQKTKAVMKKFVRLKILWRRVLGTSDLRNQQITQDVNSLVGVTSRFGRPVRVNSRFIL